MPSPSVSCHCLRSRNDPAIAVRGKEDRKKADFNLGALREQKVHLGSQRSQYYDLLRTQSYSAVLDALQYQRLLYHGDSDLNTVIARQRLRHRITLVWYLRLSPPKNCGIWLHPATLMEVRSESIPWLRYEHNSSMVTMKKCLALDSAVVGAKFAQPPGLRKLPSNIGSWAS